MAVIETLEEYLKQKKDAPNAEEIRKKWAERKDKWVAQVDQLYKNIDKWLIPLKVLGAESSLKTITLTEENIGSYTTFELTVFLAGSPVIFRPAGTNIIGGFGRVDIIGKFGQKMIVMPEWGEWKFYFRKPMPGTSDASFVWNEDFTEESFKSAMLDLVRD